MIMVAHNGVIGNQTVIGHDLNESLVSLLIDMGFQCTTEVTNFSVTKGTKVIDSHANAFVIIHTDTCHVRIATDMVVIKNCGGFT